jgi:hypothetical protein
MFLNDRTIAKMESSVEMRKIRVGFDIVRFARDGEISTRPLERLIEDEWRTLQYW